MMPHISAALGEGEKPDTNGFIGLSAGVWPGWRWNGRYVKNVTVGCRAVCFKHTEVQTDLIEVCFSDLYPGVFAQSGTELSDAELGWFGLSPLNLHLCETSLRQTLAATGCCI